MTTRPRGAKWADVPAGGIGAGVADMDLPPPQVALAAAREALEGPQGYASQAELDDVVDAADGWWRERHGLDLPRARTVVTRSAVNALAIALARLTRPGDALVRTSPGYPPIGALAAAHRLEDRPVPLVADGTGRHVPDPDALDRALDGAAVLVLAAPRNPTGTVPTRDEVAGLVDRAAAAGVVVLSDEVWADLVHAPAVHVPVAAVAAERAPDLRVVTVVGATKSFNLAALGATLVRSSHDDLHAAVTGPGHVPLLTLPSEPGRRATVAAFRHAGPWLDDTLALLRGNRDRATAALRAALGDDAVATQEGTYLLWVRAPRTWGAQPGAHLRTAAGLVVGEGADYGSPGHVRLNLATDPTTCDELVRRLVAAAG